MNNYSALHAQILQDNAAVTNNNQDTSPLRDPNISISFTGILNEKMSNHDFNKANQNVELMQLWQQVNDSVRQNLVSYSDLATC